MFEPLNSKVLVDSDGKKNETASGIYTGKYSIEGEMRRGTVMAVGPKVQELKEGDRVLFQVFLGSIIRHEDQEYFLLNEGEIVAKLENETGITIGSNGKAVVRENGVITGYQG